MAAVLFLSDFAVGFREVPHRRRAMRNLKSTLVGEQDARGETHVIDEPGHSFLISPRFQMPVECRRVVSIPGHTIIITTESSPLMIVRRKRLSCMSGRNRWSNRERILARW